MKEATGELNMTVITVVIIAALAVIGTTVVLPAISGGIRNSSCKAMFGQDEEGEAKAIKRGTGTSAVWWCCPEGTWNNTTCQELAE